MPDDIRAFEPATHCRAAENGVLLMTPNSGLALTMLLDRVGWDTRVVTLLGRLADLIEPTLKQASSPTFSHQG